VQVTVGRGNNRHTTEVATGYAFRSRPSEQRKAVVDTLCFIAGIKR